MTGKKIPRGSVTVEPTLGVVARPVALAVIVLEVVGALVARWTGVLAGTMDLLSVLHAVLLLAAGVALVWGHLRLGTALTLTVTVLALGWQSLGTDFLLWALLAAVVGLRGSRPAALGVVALGLVVAVLFGLRAQGSDPGSGVYVGLGQALLVLASLAFGRVVGTQIRRITAARTRALALLLEAENIREGERRRLATELQTLLTAGLGDLDAVAVRRPGTDAARLRSTLEQIDERSRSLLSQTRQLLSALREGDAAPTSAQVSAQEARRFRPVRIVLTVALAVLAPLGLLTDGPGVAGWMQLASCAAVIALTWIPLPLGIVPPAGVLAAVLIAAASGVAVSFWTVLLTGALCFTASHHRPRWTPWTLLATAAVATVLLLTTAGGLYGTGVGWLHAYAGVAGSLGGAARRALRREEDLAREELQRSHTSGRRAVEEERKNLARELHDVVAYQLSTMTMRIMAASMSQDRGVLEATVDACAEAVRAAQDELDTLLRGLRHEPADTAHVTPLAMAAQVEKELRRAGFHPTLDIDATADALERAQAGTVVRALQEATSNILRYAEPGSPCTLTLRVSPDHTRLTVLSALSRDHRSSNLSNGMGLRGIRERIDLLGGSFGAEPDGDRWHLWIDVPSSHAAAKAGLTPR